MNESQTPAEQTLCKMGCGFFGNGATGGCCSKCWHELQKKSSPAPAAAAASVVAASKPKEEAPSPMDVDMPTATTTESTATAEKPMEEEKLKSAATTTTTTTTTATKKKKKKASYKNMMKDMLKSSGDANTLSLKDQELRQGLGGGQFSKIDKI